MQHDLIVANKIENKNMIHILCFWNWYGNRPWLWSLLPDYTCKKKKKKRGKIEFFSHPAPQIWQLVQWSQASSYDTNSTFLFSATVAFKWLSNDTLYVTFVSHLYFRRAHIWWLLDCYYRCWTVFVRWGFNTNNNIQPCNLPQLNYVTHIMWCK